MYVCIGVYSHDILQNALACDVSLKISMYIVNEILPPFYRY